MRLSLVVPAFNEERLIAGTLQRLGAGIEVFRRHGWSGELIVCDNNSTDRTAEVARAAGATVVFEPVNQIARARNAGASAASGDWLLFVDADSSPDPELFEDVLAVIESGRYVGGGCTLAIAGAPPVVRVWASGWNALSRMACWAAGAFLFCEASAFRAAGGFSEERASRKSTCRRLKRQGRFIILHRHPLVTSGRKLQLYSWREHLAFIWKMLTAGRRTLRSRDACSLWYDGRR